MLSGKEQVLGAYKTNPEDKRLSVIFKDETLGKETRDASRYL